MNVYDFDKTIYKKDSSVQFYLYVIRKKPFIFFKCFGQQIVATVKYYLKFITKEQWKEQYFCFVKYINTEEMVDAFAEEELKNIHQWYLKKRKDNDVIITASPEFLIKAFMRRLGGMDVIGSVVDTHTGKFCGLNCYGEEKLRRLMTKYGTDVKIAEFYSDSYSDLTLAQIAEKPFLVKKNNYKNFVK